jgi:hypothetical protein
MVEMYVKRGEKSWAYFSIAYNILLTLFIGLISVLPSFPCGVFVKLFLILFFAYLFFKLCFYNGWFRNKIVGVFSRSQEMKEESKA